MAEITKQEAYGVSPRLQVRIEGRPTLLQPSILDTSRSRRWHELEPKPLRRVSDRCLLHWGFPLMPCRGNAIWIPHARPIALLTVVNMAASRTAERSRSFLALYFITASRLHSASHYPQT